MHDNGAYVTLRVTYEVTARVPWEFAVPFDPADDDHRDAVIGQLDWHDADPSTAELMDWEFNAR